MNPKREIPLLEITATKNVIEDEKPIMHISLRGEDITQSVNAIHIDVRRGLPTLAAMRALGKLNTGTAYVNGQPFPIELTTYAPGALVSWRAVSPRVTA